KDFVPVALTSKIGFVLVVNGALPVHSVADLVAYGKANPGKLAFASTGTGATPHLAGEMLKRAAGFEMTHVPYRGSPPALNDVVASPEFAAKIVDMGLIAIDSPAPDALERFLHAEIARWGKLVQDVGIAGTE